MIPINKAKAKPLITSPPKINKIITTINVVNDVIRVLDNVLFIAEFITVLKSEVLRSAINSLILSNITTVSFIE